MNDWQDFQTQWEARLLEVAKPFLEPPPANFVEGGRVAEWVDGSSFTVVVQPLAEIPARSGFWECSVIAVYEYDPNDSSEAISKTWGQILEAMGDGADGTAELRTRIAEGRLAVAGGIDAIRHEGAIEHDAEAGIFNFTFTANLSLRKAVA